MRFTHLKPLTNVSTLAKTAAVLAFTLCSTALLAQAPPSTPVQAVASFSILGDLVQQVGGQRVTVHSLVGPGADAHGYQPTPQQAKQVALADIVFSNGLGFEGWISRLLDSAAYKGRHATVTQNIRALKAPHTKDNHHGHEAGDEVDPHAWQSVPNAMVFADEIAKQLCEVDTAGCSSYQKNLAQYKVKLETLDTDIRARWATIPIAQRKVITSHDAFGYYAKAYGVQFLAPQGLSTDAEPSAKGVAMLIRQMRKDNIRALFVESISNPRLIEQIGRETGVKPAGVLFSDALSESTGPAPTYIDMMRFNTDALTRAVSAR